MLGRCFKSFLIVNVTFEGKKKKIDSLRKYDKSSNVSEKQASFWLTLVVVRGRAALDTSFYLLATILRDCCETYLKLNICEQFDV